MLSPAANQVAAACTREQAGVLARYDHHAVRVAGRWGVLITYHWLPLDEAPEPLAAKVVFNPSPKHLPSEDDARRAVLRHPRAPEEVQDIVDRLDFADAA